MANSVSAACNETKESNKRAHPVHARGARRQRARQRGVPGALEREERALEHVGGACRLIGVSVQLRQRQQRVHVVGVVMQHVLQLVGVVAGHASVEFLLRSRPRRRVREAKHLLARAAARTHVHRQPRAAHVRRPGVLGPDQQPAAAAQVARGCGAAAAAWSASSTASASAAAAALRGRRVEHGAAEDAAQLLLCPQVARVHRQERRRLLAAGRAGGCGRGRGRDAQLFERAVDLVQLFVLVLALPFALRGALRASAGLG